MRTTISVIIVVALVAGFAASAAQAQEDPGDHQDTIYLPLFNQSLLPVESIATEAADAIDPPAAVANEEPTSVNSVAPESNVENQIEEIVAGQAPARYQASGTVISFQLQTEFEGASLAIIGGDGADLRKTFANGEQISLDLAEVGNLTDGVYFYELRLLQKLAADEQAASNAGADLNGEEAFFATTQSGEFVVTNGQITEVPEKDYSTGVEDPGTDSTHTHNPGVEDPDAPQVIFHNGDGSIEGSLCVSDVSACLVAEAFGNESFKVKDSIPEILLEDTTGEDFSIIANGGRFRIENQDDSRNLVVVDENATTNSIFVGEGEIGLFTATPVNNIELTVNETSGTTSDIRMLTSGEDWQLEADPSGFDIRNITSGFFPFRIEDGAGSNTLVVDDNERVGIGTTSPDQKLTVFSSNNTANLKVDENAANAKKFMLTLENNGAPQFKFTNTATGNEWQFSMLGTGNFAISKLGTGGSEFQIAQNGTVFVGPGSDTVLKIEPDGDLIIDGNLSQGSSRAFKENILLVDAQTILEQVAELEIATWNYRSDEDGIQHLGPMAENFHELFGLGVDEQHLSPMDATGVSLAAIQGMYEMLQEKDAQIAVLEAELAQLWELEERLEALEALLADSE